MADWENGVITDEAIERLRSQIGVRRSTQPWNSVATYDAIWHFAHGVGDDNPLWWDPEYARTSRWGQMFAPPTFLYSCSKGGPENGRPPGGLVEFDVLQGVMGFWSTDRWVWHSHAWLDERVHATNELHDVQELDSRFAGRSIAHVDKTTYYGEDDRVIAELFHTVIRVERSAGRRNARYLDTPPHRYSDEDIKALHEQYELEPAQRRGRETLYLDECSVGDELITLVKGPLTMTSLVGWQQGWGSLLCHTNRIAYQLFRDHPGCRLVDPQTGIEDTLAAGHWEPAFTTKGGLPRGYDFGGQRISYVAHLLTDWCGDDGFLAELTVRLLRPNFFGDCTWVTGTVADVQERLDPPLADLTGYGAARCEVTATNQRGELTASATALVALPRRNISSVVSGLFV